MMSTAKLQFFPGPLGFCKKTEEWVKSEKNVLYHLHNLSLSGIVDLDFRKYIYPQYLQNKNFIKK